MIGAGDASATSAKHTTAGNAGSMVAKDAVPQLEQIADAGISNAIVDLLTVTARVHESTPAEAPQVRRDATLGYVERLHEFADTALSIGRIKQEREETQARRVAKHPEETRC
jgi:hypothetical protein